MIRIGRMAITLPPELQHRARPIVTHAGHALAHGTQRESANIGALTGLQARCSANQTDQEIGNAIAAAIGQALANRR